MTSEHDVHKRDDVPGDEERAEPAAGHAGVSMHPATRDAVEQIKAAHKMADQVARAKRQADPHSR